MAIIISILEDGSIYSDAQSALQTLKKFRLSVESGPLTAALDEEIDAFRTSIMPAVLHYGMKNLPDDVLSDILSRDTCEYDFYDEFNPSLPRALDLERTCKRFRRLVLSTWECWTRVSNAYLHKMSLRRVKFQLDKFMNSPIDLVITSSEAKRTAPLLETVLLTTAYRARIRSLHWSWIFAPAFPIPRGLSNARLEFPNLKSMRIASNIWENFPRWSFPQLTYLESSNVPPPNWTPLLRAWRPYGPYGRRPDIHWGCFYPFLETVPRLQSLQLDLIFSYGWIRVIPRNVVSLPELEVLQISLNDHFHHLESFYVFPETVKFPKLRTVEFSGRGVHNFSSLFAPDSEFLTVESLTLHGIDSPLILDYVHKLFPCLQNLVIQTNHHILWSDKDFTPRFLPCGKLTIKLTARDNHWLKNIQALTGYRTFGARLDRIEVISGKHVWFMTCIEPLVREILSLALPRTQIWVDPLIGALGSENRSLEILRSEIEKDFT